ncbi:MAG: DUF3800 domain-containing protein [Planctomycetes bacterium]|nr:DUF3800 domain-containing protein [Planctomycetota bacterium]
MTSLVAYCDESGQRDYGTGTDRHFVVAGVVANATEASQLEDELRGLKRAFWGNPDIELKSNWVRIPSARRKNYTDKHGIQQKQIESLLAAVYPWLENAPIRLLAAVVDKQQMEARYKEPHYSGTVAYTVFLQRLQKYAAKVNATANVVFDDPAGKSPGGFDWRDLLLRLHAKLLKHGCPYTRTTFDRIGTLTFTDSTASPFVQIADQVSYNVFRQFRDHGDAWEDDSLKNLPMYKYFQLMIDMFDQGPSRQFAGFGVTKWPIDKKVQWVVTG